VKDVKEMFLALYQPQDELQLTCHHSNEVCRLLTMTIS